MCECMCEGCLSLYVDGDVVCLCTSYIHIQIPVCDKVE